MERRSWSAKHIGKESIQPNRQCEVSWYQTHATKSLELIRQTGVDSSARIIDVGGGASTLVDDLLADGFRDLTVLDISGAALDTARQRLGALKADDVTWREDDVTQTNLPSHSFDLWHDRAVFHFLAAPEERRRYVAIATCALKPGGHLIIAAFASDGPLRCSGLDVVRYSVEELRAEFTAFRLVESCGEEHSTPFGTKQKFIYCRCTKASGESVVDGQS